MELKHITGTVERAGDKITFIASDETKDRYGDSIPILNWDLSKYRKAPRLLVDHDHRVEKIVGKASGIRVDKGAKKLLFEPLFHGITELSRQVEEMVKTGHLDTVSVGFIPHPPADKTKGTFDGKNELIEISFVTVPANPNAHQIKSLIEKEEKEEVANDIDKFFVRKFTGETTIKQFEVQSLVISKKEFTKDKAEIWASDHAFKTKGFEETKNSYMFKQFDTELCTEGSERSVSLQKGVKAIICSQNKNVEQDDIETPVIKETKSESVQTLDTPAKDLKGKLGTGRSLSREHRQERITVEALKKASKIINLALYKAKNER